MRVVLISRVNSSDLKHRDQRDLCLKNLENVILENIY